MGDRIEYEPVPNWGKIPHGMTFRGSATSVAVDSLDRVYVFNRGTHPLMVFDPYGNLLRTWGSPDQFKRPHSITIDEHDHMFLVDDGGHTVEKRTLDGELIFTLGKRGEPAPWQSGGMFNRPTDVAIHRRTGELFVSDGYGNSRVHRFSPEGEHLLSWGEPGADPGQFSLPHSIVVAPDDRVVVADRENFRIQVFDLDGSFIEQWHLYRPAAVASDARSGLRFYVGEHSPHKIQKGVPRLGCRIKVLDEAGNELARFGGELPGHEPDQFMDPHGIAVDSSGDVYVAEVCNSWLLSLDGPPPLGEWPSLRKWRLVGG